MKNLLIYTREDGRFSTEAKVLAKIQIENSLSLGWKPKDILLFTNFPFSYMGVDSMIIPDLSYKPDRTNKIPVIVYLLEMSLLPDELIWYHDFDAYQDGPIDIHLKKNLGLTSYGYKKQWNCGSFFFTTDAESTFKDWNLCIYPRKRADEKTLSDLTRQGIINDFEEVGIEYNYGQRLPEFGRYKNVVPRVLHFHPYYKYYKAEFNNLDIFMYGKNRWKVPLMSARLTSIFQKHGIK